VDNENESDSAEPLAPGSNPHVLWRQLTGLVLWVSFLGYIMYEFVFLWPLALGGVTFADAWKSGVYKDRSRKSIINISPMSWGIAMAILPLVTYPTYLISRKKLRTKHAGNGFLIATIVLGAMVLWLFIDFIYWNLMISIRLSQ
jgi:hypothetical protein